MAESGRQVEIAARDFDLDAVFTSGQCFRWRMTAPGTWRGVAYGKRLTVCREGANLLLSGTDKAEFKEIWFNYFDLARDYGALKRQFGSDPALSRAVAFAPGMRLLKQEPWEALCSFIISQNNNIPRIKGIVERLCALYGEPLGDGDFSFPAAERLAGLCEEDLNPIRCGFRSAYILDAARRVASGEIELRKLNELPLDEARAQLKKIRGVGPKVAECALLYGYGRVECFPVDVWIRRVLDCLYPQGFPQEFSAVAGIAQQYLFHYARCCPSCDLSQAKRA